MSGFSPSWLALREPADHASRDPGLVAALARSLAGRATPTVLDLGCGTGSNLRGLGPHLGPSQSWRLIDHDPALLAAARASLIAWADTAQADGDGLVLTKDGSRISVAFAALDLSGGFDAALLAAADLVTAAALFDLVSRAFIDGLADAVAAAGSLFYTSLSYDGTEEWSPPHPADEAVHAAFLAHQEGDKGFGPALGREATPALAEAFRERGYAVSAGLSPWRLGAAEADLIGELVAGKAGAVGETGSVDADVIQSWVKARRRPDTQVTIGHADLLAMPA